MQKKVHELQTLTGFVNEILTDNQLSWKDKYSQIFSPHCSKRIYALFKELCIEFNYDDQDADYDDDVIAFCASFQARMAEIQPILEALSTSITITDGTPDLRYAQRFSDNLALAATVSIRVPPGLSDGEAGDFVREQLTRAVQAAPALSFSVVIGEPDL